MKRSELEHLIRAAGAIADDPSIVVIGSQSILGQFPQAPASLLVSMEADVFPLHRPELSDLIDGSIGEGSPFHELYGYYAQGVSESTAILPEGWRERLVAIENPNTNGVRGLCLEVHDLAVAKYVAGREKDLAFTRELARNRMVSRDLLLRRLGATSISPALRKLVRARLERDHGGAAPAVRRPRSRRG
jgi:hypothetical protein